MHLRDPNDDANSPYHLVFYREFPEMETYGYPSEAKHQQEPQHAKTIYFSIKKPQKMLKKETSIAGRLFIRNMCKEIQ